MPRFVLPISACGRSSPEASSVFIWQTSSISGFCRSFSAIRRTMKNCGRRRLCIESTSQALKQPVMQIKNLSQDDLFEVSYSLTPRQVKMIRCGGC